VLHTRPSMQACISCRAPIWLHFLACLLFSSVCNSVLSPHLKTDALNCTSCIGLQVCTAVMKAAGKSSNPSTLHYQCNTGSLIAHIEYDVGCLGCSGLACNAAEMLEHCLYALLANLHTVVSAPRQNLEHLCAHAQCCDSSLFAAWCCFLSLTLADKHTFSSSSLTSILLAAAGLAFDLSWLQHAPAAEAKVLVNQALCS